MKVSNGLPQSPFIRMSPLTRPGSNIEDTDAHREPATRMSHSQQIHPSFASIPPEIRIDGRLYYLRSLGRFVGWGLVIIVWHLLVFSGRKQRGTRGTDGNTVIKREFCLCTHLLPHSHNGFYIQVGLRMCPLPRAAEGLFLSLLLRACRSQ